MFFLTVFRSDCTKIMSGYILFVFIITDNYEQSMSIKERYSRFPRECGRIFGRVKGQETTGKRLTNCCQKNTINLYEFLSVCGRIQCRAEGHLLYNAAVFANRETERIGEKVMARYEGVSASVIRRLPRYYRFLYDLIQRDVHRISSRELAELMNLTASQIRQDLNCFGGFGQQGYGYNVDALYEEIGNILGLNKGRKIILLGAGNLGMALVKHLSFEAKGFRMIGIFDKNPKLIGQKIHGIEIMPESELESFCQKNKPDAAVLCLPKVVVEELGDRLISYGIRAFWNFSHYDLGLRHRDKGTPIVVENVHLGDSLMTLCYQVNELDED